jgi:hypothetical protein
MKKLSEQLAELSVRAKNAEDAMGAAKKETQDKMAATREKARLAATAAVEKVNQDLKSSGESMAKDWNAVKAKVAGDITALKSKAAQAKQEHDVKSAEKRADRLEWEAAFAIDYAIASIEQATVAALDAVDARMAADKVKRAA